MIIGEKEIEKIVYQCFIEELEDIGTVFTESVQRVKEFVAQENP